MEDLVWVWPILILASWLWGGLPTADWLARLAKVELRSEGGNPGANNAFRRGGVKLGVSVLLVEIVKGGLWIWWVRLLTDDFIPMVVVACWFLILGNIFNPYFRLRGGQGLGIAGGVAVVIWPPMLIPTAVLLLGFSWLTKSTARASLITLPILVLIATLWNFLEWPNAWGINSDGLIWYTAGLVMVIGPKQAWLLRQRQRNQDLPAG